MLPGALREAQAIASHCYPGARYLGPPPGGPGQVDGTGTPREVLDHLPTTERTGASMLHLGCHGLISARPGRSHLVLAGDAELQVDTILRQARWALPDRPTTLLMFMFIT